LESQGNRKAAKQIKRALDDIVEKYRRLAAENKSLLGFSVAELPSKKKVVSEIKKAKPAEIKVLKTEAPKIKIVGKPTTPPSVSDARKFNKWVESLEGVPERSRQLSKGQFELLPIRFGT